MDAPSEVRGSYRLATFGRLVLVVVVLTLVADLTLVLVLALVAFRPGSSLPTPTRQPSGSAVVENPSPAWLTEADGSLFFRAKDPTYGRELWTSDDTRSGTVMVRDIRPGAHGSGPSELATVGETLFFTANDGVSGRELWTSDGTAEGTVLVDDIMPGAKGSVPYAFADVGGRCSSLRTTASTATNYGGATAPPTARGRSATSEKDRATRTRSGPSTRTDSRFSPRTTVHTAPSCGGATAPVRGRSSCAT